MESLNKLPPMFVDTFIRQIKMLRLIGIDIFEESDTNVVRKYIRHVISLGLLFFMLAGELLYIVKKDEVGATFLDLVYAISSTFAVIQIISDLLKLNIMATKKKAIREVIWDIGKLWETNFGNEMKNEDIKIRMRRLMLLEKVLYGCLCLALMFLGLVPLGSTIYAFHTETNPEYKLVLPMYFFCYLDSHITYFAAFVYQIATCAIYQSCVYVSCDYLLLGLSFDVSVLLRSVQSDLLNLKGTLNMQDVTFREHDDCRDIINIAKTHQALLSLAKRLNEIFQEIIFSQLYLTSVVICCYGFSAMMSDGILLNVRNLMASMDIAFSIYLLALPGQMLVEESLGVAEAAYNCPWYDRSNKFRKYIAIIMVRAQKPAYLSALGFSDLSLVICSKVGSTIWSYLSLLNHMLKNIEI